MEHGTTTYIQFRENPVSRTREQKNIEREAGDTVSVRFIDGLDTTLPWDDPQTVLGNAQGVMFGGSGDYDFDGGRPENDPVREGSRALLARMTPLLSYIFERDIPTFGICYGHQLIGAYRGASVRHDKTQHKRGTHEIFLTDKGREHAFLRTFPDSFHAQYGHKDVLDRIPSGAVLLAHGGERCRVAALQYRENIVTTQFHPELDAATLRARFLQNGYLPEGSDVDKVVLPSPHATALLKNFFARIRESAS